MSEVGATPQQGWQECWLNAEALNAASVVSLCTGLGAVWEGLKL